MIVSPPVGPAHLSKQITRKPSRNCIVTHESIHESFILPPPQVSVEQAYKDFRREGVVVNGIIVYPVLGQYDEEVIQTVHKLVEKLQRLSVNISDEDIADIILQRACRTSSGADSFLSVRKKFLRDGTVLVQRHKERDISNMTRIDIFLDSGALCCVAKSTNIYALYDTKTIDDGDSFTPPLLTFHTIVKDVSNFSSKMNSRTMYIRAVKYFPEMVSIRTDSENGSAMCEEPS